MSGHSGQDVYIGFVAGASTPFAVSGSNGSLRPVSAGNGFPSPGNWYSLNSLGGAVKISALIGRIYVCYGQPWSVQAAAYEPAQNPSDPNFYLRYDFMNVSYTGQPDDSAAMTAFEYWSIPLSLSTKMNGSAVASLSGLRNGATANTLYQELNALTSPPVSGVEGPGGVNGNAIPAVVPGSYQQAPGGPAPGSNFARVLGPRAYPPFLPTPGGIPVMPYDTLESYLKYLNDKFGQSTEKDQYGLGKGICCFIKGTYSGTGDVYRLEGQIGMSGSKLVLRLAGSSSIAGDITMLYEHDDLVNPLGLYGGAAPFKLNGQQTVTPTNNLYGRIASDFFAGLNIGAVGSETVIAGTPVKAMSSSDWFSKIPVDQMYAGLQTNANCYNQWAAVITKMTQDYGFSYNDRIDNVQINLNPQRVNELEVTLEKDNVNY